MFLNSIAFSDFVLDGFPVISLICFLITLVLIALSARASPNFGVNNNGGIPLLGISLWFIFTAIFCVFTPVSKVQRIAVLVFLIGASGTYTVLTGEKHSLRFFVVLSFISLLCMIGAAAFFGYDSFWSSISANMCQATGTRCRESFLTWIRIITTFDIYLMILAVIIALGAYQASEPSKQ